MPVQRIVVAEAVTKATVKIVEEVAEAIIKVKKEEWI